MKRLLLVVAAGAVCVSLAGASVVALRPKTVVPTEIKKQLTSTLILPTSDIANVAKETVKYNSKDKLLSYTLGYAATTIIISEQPTPEQFTDIPQVYDKVVSQMSNYTSFETKLGTVHLTRPPSLGGKQAAVLNAKGTLLFAKPDKNLTDDQWRQFFLQLDATN